MGSGATGDRRRSSCCSSGKWRTRRGRRGSSEPKADWRTIASASSSPAATRLSRSTPRVALTLRTLGGLTTPEIARAFLVPEATLAQRLVRAKRKIRQAGIPYRVPLGEELPERLDSVLATLYLVFNEGYLASTGDTAVRHELCAEAIRLAALVADLIDRKRTRLNYSYAHNSYC